MKAIGGTTTFTVDTGKLQALCETPSGMEEAQPWVVAIPSAIAPVGEVTQFPAQDAASFWAGIVPDWAEAGNSAFDDGQVAMVVEYGAAGASERVTFDWVPGYYNIPPSTFVRVSVWAQGNAVPATFRAALMPGVAHNARVPTVTGVHRFAGAGNASVGRVSKGKAYEAWATTPQNVVLDQAGGGGGGGSPAARRDSLGLVYTPPWTPIDYDEHIGPNGPSGNVRVTVTAACDVVFRWYLGL